MNQPKRFKKTPQEKVFDILLKERTKKGMSAMELAFTKHIFRTNCLTLISVSYVKI